MAMCICCIYIHAKIIKNIYGSVWDCMYALHPGDTKLPLRTYWAPLGPNGQSPNGPPWACMGQAIMGGALMGPMVGWALLGQALMLPLMP